MFNPNKNLFNIKKLDEEIVFKTKIGAKITIEESKKMIHSFVQTFNNELNLIKNIIGEKKISMRVESSQFVNIQNKVRYFSSRIQIDKLLSSILGFTL